MEEVKSAVKLLGLMNMTAGVCTFSLSASPRTRFLQEHWSYRIYPNETLISGEYSSQRIMSEKGQACNYCMCRAEPPLLRRVITMLLVDGSWLISGIGESLILMIAVLSDLTTGSWDGIQFHSTSSHGPRSAHHP